jgi:PAS domain S-box-containing protein
MPENRLLRPLMAIVDALPYTVVTVDGHGRIDFGNAAWHRSATAQALPFAEGGVGQLYADVLSSVVRVSADDHQQVLDGLALLLRGQTDSFEHECAVTVLGTPRWFRVLMSITDAEPGAVIQHLETTGGHRDQKARSDALAQFSAIFETALDGIIIFDDELRLLVGNPAVSQIFGRPAEQLAGARITDIMSAANAEVIRRQQQELLVEGTKRGMLRGRRPDGSSIDIEYVARANIVPGRHLAQLRDMTMTRRLEQELRHAQKMQAIGQLTGGIAHDFNNLLTVIVAESDFLLYPGTIHDQPTRDGLTKILSVARRGADMVRKLMAFGRQGQLHCEAVNLDTLVAAVITMVRHVLPDTIAVHHQRTADLPHAWVDATATEQMLMNLVNNARDAMQERGGEIRIVLDADDRFVRISVTDTGVGMSEEVMLRAFDPFFTTKKVGEGTGLGLAMVYGLSEQMGGRTEVQSQLGVGTTIRLLLPIAEAPAIQIPTAALDGIAAVPDGERVLLVEDDDAIRGLAARVLRRAGYRVTEAIDGDSAAEQIETAAASFTPYAIIVSDIVMPNGGGVRVLDARRRVAARTPLLWVTGHPGAIGDDGRSQAPSDDPLLQKPWSAAELVLRVQSAIAHASVV